MNVAEAAQQCVAALEAFPEIKRARIWVSPKQVVSICRRFKFSKRNRHNDFVLKIGAPNYAERLLQKRCGPELRLGVVGFDNWPKKRA